MGLTEALEVQGITARVCTYKHFQYLVKEVWTILRYLRKQQKMSQIQRATRNTQCHKILVETASVCATSDKLINCLSQLRVLGNHSLHWLQREMEDFRAYFWSV